MKDGQDSTTTANAHLERPPLPLPSPPWIALFRKLFSRKPPHRKASLTQQLQPPNLEFLHRAPFPQLPQLPQANIGFLHGATFPSYEPLQYGPTPSQQGTTNVQFLSTTLSRDESYRDFPSKTSPTRSSSRTIEMHNALFQYPSLQDYRSDIRLVRVEPGSISDEICCCLVCVPLNPNITAYECLSYCWGDSQQTVPIKVQCTKDSKSKSCVGGNQDFSITTNLARALQHLRQTDSPRLLWIDAICIDQRNTDERAAQVSLMRNIYSKSTSVIVWIEGSTNTTESSISFVRELAVKFERDTGISPDQILGPTGIRLDWKHLQLLKEYKFDHEISEATRHAYSAIGDFFSHPWFRRVWVLQEVSSASSATVLLGNHSLPWGAVVLAALWQALMARWYLRNLETTSEVPSAVFSKNPGHVRRLKAAGYLPELWLSLMQAGRTKAHTILELVFRAREFQATDPRDKIFALLGLVAGVEDVSTLPPGQVPDYTKTKAETYCNFAKSIILHQKSLDILSAVDTFTVRSPWHNYIAPSWMPNLDIAIPTIRGYGYPPKYRASRDMEAMLYCHSDPEVLSLSGFRIDSVRTLSPEVLNLRPDLRIYLGDLNDGIRIIWKDFIRDPPACPSGDNLLESYMYTLTSVGFASGEDQFPKYPLGNIIPSQQVPSLFVDFASYWGMTEPDFASLSEPDRCRLRPLVGKGDADQFAVVAGKACHERRFFLSREGYMGLCPRASRQDDLVIILDGGSVPYVVRELPGPGSYFKLIGECYVHGRMFGSAIDEREQKSIPVEIFNLR